MENLLECKICLVDYSSQIPERMPRLLSCRGQHVICTACLKGLDEKRVQNKQNHIKCPFDREKIPYQTLNDIPKSRILIELLDNQANIPSSNLVSTNISENNLIKAKSVKIDYKPTYEIAAETSNNLNQSFNQKNIKSYLKSVFELIDVDNSGALSVDELQRALYSVHNKEFSLKTVKLLMSKYDKNNDKSITFDEFYDLYGDLNTEYESFLLMDVDGNGHIDQNELEQGFSSKGYKFTKEFYQHVISEISKKTGDYGVEFDHYIRLASRFDYLCHFYRETPYYHQVMSLENYLKKTMFLDFW